MTYISATKSIFLLSICVFLFERTNGHMLGIDKDDGIVLDKRFILTTNSKQNWTTLEQFSSCSLTCVPGFEKLTQVCCDTGLNAVCSNLPWTSLKAKLGTCVDLTAYGITTTAWSSLEQFAACFLSCVPGFEKLTEVCCQTGLDAVCTNLPWDSLKTSLGQCHALSPCSSNPCVHGTCHQNSSTFQCTCASGYSGVLCDKQILSCASSSCVHGSCINVVTRLSCKCDIGYTGVNCDQDVKDCKDVLDNHVTNHSGSGVYTVKINGHLTDVMCDMVTSGGGWTVIMNRENNKQNFGDQSFSSYAEGFGDVWSNFWAGLKKMNGLTNDGRRYQLRVELVLANGSKYFAMYDEFSIGPPNDFVLHVGRYTGNAGDSLSKHYGYGFTNKDVDNDSNPSNCGIYLHGAWWFHSCYDSCLTCPYETPGSHTCRSFSWNTLAYCIALKSAQMMVRPM